ncbi:MAG: hypothetical protein AAFY84_00680 [Pseudomonadota bacterium]
MTLEAIYYITQIVAVLAVLASLLFVAFQIRQNTDQMRVQNSAHLQDRYDSWWLMVGQDAELADAYGKLIRGEKVDPPQAAQLRVFTAMMANVGWTAYIAMKKGTGSSKLAFKSELFYATMIATPLGYGTHKSLFRGAGPVSLYDKRFENDFAQEWCDRVESRRADILAERAKVTAAANAKPNADKNTLP